MLADAIGVSNKRAAGSPGPSAFGAAPPQCAFSRPVAGSGDCRLWGGLVAKRNLRLLCGLLDDESLEYAVPQFIAECIRLQTFWLVSLAKQDGTHSVLNVWHDYKVIQADSLFNDLGALIFALEIGVAADTGKLAAQNVQVLKIFAK